MTAKERGHVCPDLVPVGWVPGVINAGMRQRRRR
jgi:hypothetical protein